MKGREKKVRFHACRNFFLERIAEWKTNDRYLILYRHFHRSSFFRRVYGEVGSVSESVGGSGVGRVISVAPSHCCPWSYVRQSPERTAHRGGLAAIHHVHWQRVVPPSPSSAAVSTHAVSVGS